MKTIHPEDLDRLFDEGEDIREFLDLTAIDRPNNLPLIDAEGEVRELTDEDLEQFKPAHEVLSDELKKSWV
jgi:hypothetical protein